ncbi:hypothetical protein D3C84_496420 [compost metagenome]
MQARFVIRPVVGKQAIYRILRGNQLASLDIENPKALGRITEVDQLDSHIVRSTDRKPREQTING